MSGQSVYRDAAPLALDVHGRQGLEIKLVGQLSIGPLADENLSPPRPSGQPGSEVHLIAHDCEILARRRAHIAGKDMAAADPHALINGHAKLGDLVAHVQGRQGRSLFVILMGDQGPEGY